MESPILAPSAVPLKSTRRSKPSKQVISQTIVYKEKHKPPKAEVTPQQEEDTEEESFDTSPAQGTEAEVPGEEFVLDGGEATGSEIPEEDKNLVEETKIVEKNTNENDKVVTKKTLRVSKLFNFRKFKHGSRNIKHIVDQLMNKMLSCYVHIVTS